MTRLCEPIEGIDAYHVAQCLGLDPTGFKHKSSSSSPSSSNGLNIAPAQLSKQQKKLQNFTNELEKYSNCLPFKYVCPSCKTESTWQSPFVKSNVVKQEPTTTTTTTTTSEPVNEDEDMKIDEFDHILTAQQQSKSTAASNSSSSSSSSFSFKCILDACANNECKLKPMQRLAYIKNALTLQMNKFIKQYMQMWLICDDPLCQYRTKRLSCKLFGGRVQCIECERYNASLEYAHSDLYYQMRFFRFLFDLDAFKSFYKDDALEITNMMRNNKEMNSALNQLKDHVNKKLKMNSFGVVNMTDLFKFL